MGCRQSRNSVGDHVQLIPHFKVKENKTMMEAKDMMEACIKGVKTSTDDILYYGFTVMGDDEFMCREGYKNADALITHLSDLKEELARAVEVADVVYVDCLGPEKELKKLEEPLKAFGPVFYASHGASLSFLPLEGAVDTHMSLQPKMEVKEGKMDELKKLLSDCTAATRKGTKLCKYYGFYINGNTVRCREGYENAEGVLAHLNDVAEPLGKIMELAEVKIEVHGTKEDIEKAREAITKAVPTATYWVLQEGAVTGAAVEKKVEEKAKEESPQEEAKVQPKGEEQNAKETKKESAPAPAEAEEAEKEVA